MTGLPLTPGARGEAVRDLHRRLAAAGVPVATTAAVYSPDTEHAVSQFQRSRGLEPTGVCDAGTWNALVEAGYTLGERPLYHTSPMLRGDDVAELQRRVGSLGFDAGRVDGIYGPHTERAVADFQRNAGLPSDGIAGSHTIAELQRLSARADLSRPVMQVREEQSLRDQPRELSGFRIAIGEDGGLHALVHTAARLLRERGAVVLEEHHPDWSVQARNANEFGAQLFVAVCPADNATCEVSYFATEGYESPGGRRLAELCATVLPPACGAVTAELAGLRSPVLRETRMPAVRCRIGPPSAAVTRANRVANALVAAVGAWIHEPIGR
jgi:N-acetylmuramoyl-L-alanine amidase